MRQYNNKYSLFKRAISFIKLAVSSSEQDYTKLGIHRSIFLLAIPMVFEMSMESIFALADIFFVAKLGPDATAAVGLAESLLVLVYALGFGIGMPATALVARRIGEKNPEDAAIAAVQINIIGIIL